MQDFPSRGPLLHPDVLEGHPSCIEISQAFFLVEGFGKHGNDLSWEKFVFRRGKTRKISVQVSEEKEAQNRGISSHLARRVVKYHN